MSGVFSRIFEFARKATGRSAPPTSGRLRDTVQRRLGQIRAEREALGEKALIKKREEKEAEFKRNDPVYRFVQLGETIYSPHSSNVGSAWYEADAYTLYLQFKDGSTYAYFGVWHDEAESYALAGSKGRWVWDVLRVRGKGNFHSARKEYALVTPGARHRKWEATKASALAHSQKVASASGAKTPYERLGKLARKRPRGK